MSNFREYAASSVEEPAAIPSAEERWALLQRIAASELFSRSARLRDFLLYVGKQSLKPGSPEIHEQEIGTKVFGRPQDYDRSQDNIVRVNASELRRRIDAYFETQGAQEPLTVEIPRGGYTPVFHFRQSAEGGKSDLKQTAEPSDARAEEGKGRRSWRTFFWPAVCAALALGVAFLYLQNRVLLKAAEPWRDRPTVAAFWKQFLASDKQTDIVVPDDSLSTAEDITGSPVNLNEYVDRSFIRRISSFPLSDDRRADTYEVLNHNLVTFGAVRAAQLILEQIPLTESRALVWSRLYTADEIKRNNAVLIGGRKANPWNQIFEDQLNFVIGYDASLRRGYIRNRAPKPNEQNEYTYSGGTGTADEFATYAVVAYLLNPSHTGHVVILAGLDSDATAAAGEFLTSEEQMARLKATMHVDTFPSFEVLLKASRLNGTSFRADVVTYRIH